MERREEALREKKKQWREAARWMEGKIRERYALAEVRLVEDKIAVVYLDGASEEVCV